MASPAFTMRQSVSPWGIVVLLGVVLSSCGGDGTPSPATEAPPSSSSSTSAPSTSTEPPASTTTAPDQLEQLALWPAPSVVFTSPRAAAEDFVIRVLGVPPEVGEFMAGDARSGEIEVYSPGDPPTVRGLLLMRQLGANNGWFVIGTVNDNALITSPLAGQSVTAGPLVVQGLAEGFEATVIVEAYVVGRVEQVLDRQVTFAGNLGIPGPFEVTLDISGAAPGDTVLVVIRGGVGLETDPGQFGAIAVVIVE